MKDEKVMVVRTVDLTGKIQTFSENDAKDP